MIIRETDKTFWHAADMPYMTFDQLVQYRTGGQKANQKYHVERCLKGADRSRYHYTKEEALQAFVRRNGIIPVGYRCTVEKLPGSDMFLAVQQPGPIASEYSWGEY